MVRVALVGLGKMGISHLAMIKAHPDVDLVAVCDMAGYMLDILGKYTGVKTYADYSKLLETEQLDAVFIATPSRFHGEMVRAALERGLHVFCEKPFCLDPVEGKALAELAQAKGLVNQVGYHYRFVGAFQRAKKIIESGALGRVHHILAEAYGPVVLRPKGSTWRTSKSEGGGCLYDYVCHAVDTVNYLVGVPTAVGGTVLNKIFSRDVDDEVYSTLFFADGMTGQVAANWSDDSYRKMSTKITVSGLNGRLVVDRQEVQVYLRDASTQDLGLQAGWNIGYTTEYTEPTWFYLRGEEYSAQIDHFIRAIVSGNRDVLSSFASATATDTVLSMMLSDAETGRRNSSLAERPEPGRDGRKPGLISNVVSRLFR